MKSKYIDTNAIMQVIGCVFNDNSLLNLEDRYSIVDTDFCNDFHKILFGSIYHLHSMGVNKVTIQDIENFLSAREEKLSIYKENKGSEYLIKVSQFAENNNFEYYYKRMKKMSLLRAYDNLGIDVSYIYDPNNVFDVKKKQAQEDFLDNAEIENIIDKIDSRIDTIKQQYSSNTVSIQAQAGEGIFDLIERFKQTPDVGVPLYGPFVNTITRGARLKKFYLRSAPSGWGKTRTMIADACNIACGKIYNEAIGWSKNGSKESVLYISTELELDEVQSMMLAFVSNVNEEHILNGTYEAGEEERVIEAAKIISESDIYIEIVPDFTLRDIENLIKRNIREHDISYVMYDYIHSSIGILSEITKATGGIKLREDNILFMLSTKLKDICNQYGVFILSSTQLNGDWQQAESPDQNLLRGAKSIADKIDIGELILPATEEDIKSLETIINGGSFETPTIKLCFYKNRRARYKNVILWCKADLGVCRITPMFCTTYNYELINIDNLKIMVAEEEGAF